MSDERWVPMGRVGQDLTPDDLLETLSEISGLLGLAGIEKREPRRSTEDEIVRAAWANLAIERPDFTLAEARRMHYAEKHFTHDGTQDDFGNQQNDP